MDKYRVYAGIDLKALRHNMESMHGNIDKNTKIAAVIKTDAYGHGALEVARAIEDLPYLWGYAVATADEALSLIEDGRRKPVLILGISFEEQYADIIENGIRPTVCGAQAAEKLSEIAASLGKACKIHIKVDTGMNRIGFPANESSADAIAKIAALPGIEIEGIFTHFARADEASKEPVKIQIGKFMGMRKMLDSRGVSIPIWHCSNSAGIVEIPEANFDMVRAGITLYGMWPSDDVERLIDLKPVMSLHSHVSFLKALEAGEPVSYGGTYVTPERRVIATVPVGYGDGYARSLSNVGSVLIRGQRAKICGRVCMDQMMVDVTDIPGVCEGDKVTLLGADGGERITMEELGELSGRFNYEFSCLITPRVPRVYFE
ncbi:MAG: alanine racemase [Clostridiales bacterium]|nr:alanine racemase [Clostridiales bacterium]